MKQFLPGKIWISLVVFILVTSGGAIASENKRFATQGRVMELNLIKNILIVNEQTFVLDQNTTIRDARGSSLAMEGLRAKTWVYIEGVGGGRGQQMIATKIYVLQKRVGRQERHLYSFMQPLAED